MLKDFSVICSLTCFCLCNLYCLKFNVFPSSLDKKSFIFRISWKITYKLDNREKEVATDLKLDENS